MSKELNAPEWIKAVIVDPDVEDKDHMVPPHWYSKRAVIASAVNAIERYEREHPARRPWASLSADPTHPADFADFDKFCRWIRAGQDPDEHFKLLSYASDRDPYGAMLWLYGLLRDAYEGRQPTAPRSETGDKP